MIIDRLVRARFLVNKKYKYFCNWSKNLNIDHAKNAVKNPLLKINNSFFIKLRHMTSE